MNDKDIKELAEKHGLWVAPYSPVVTGAGAELMRRFRGSSRAHNKAVVQFMNEGVAILQAKNDQDYLRSLSASVAVLRNELETAQRDRNAWKVAAEQRGRELAKAQQANAALRNELDSERQLSANLQERVTVAVGLVEQKTRTINDLIAQGHHKDERVEQLRRACDAKQEQLDCAKELELRERKDCYFPDLDDPLGQKHVKLKYRELVGKYVALRHELDRAQLQVATGRAQVKVEQELSQARERAVEKQQQLPAIPPISRPLSAEAASRALVDMNRQLRELRDAIWARVPQQAKSEIPCFHCERHLHADGPNKVWRICMGCETKQAKHITLVHPRFHDGAGY
jgi:DNA repair exonuclease SbcCD ATPase subunit